MNGWKQIANTPEFKKREEYDLISDGSSTYYQKKFYFDNSSCPYLFTDTERLSYSIEDNNLDMGLFLKENNIILNLSNYKRFQDFFLKIFYDFKN